MLGVTFVNNVYIRFKIKYIKNTSKLLENGIINALMYVLAL